MRRPILLLVLLLFMPALAQPGRELVGQNDEHTVAGGDTLYSVARAHRLALEHLAFANRLAPDLRPLKAGRILIPGRRVLPGSPPADGLVLNLPERGLFLFRQGTYAGFYPVAIGMPGWNTPVGEFRIVSRVVDPTWSPPSWAGVAGPVGPGPDNPLGDRWMGLSLGGYGIHATNVPSSIGGAVSHGCIRMYPELARELFERVTVGMPIRIEYEPVKLGQEPDGRVALAVFPDVYGRVDLMSEAERCVAELGPLVDPVKLRQIVGRATGVPEPLVGDELEVVAGEEPLGKFVCAVAGGRLYVPLSLLTAAGFEAQEQAGQARIARDGAELAVPALPLGSGLLVPAVPVLTHFGWGVKMDGGTVVLRH